MRFFKSWNIDKIREYVSLYMQGESTLDQERYLQAYFRNGDIDKEFLEYAPLFGYIDAEQFKSVKKNVKVISFWSSISAVAAVLVIAFILNTNKGEFRYIVDGKEVNDMHLALAQAQQELDKLSGVLKILEEKEKDIKESLKPLNRLQIISDSKEE
jgi:hypothetical protein